MKILFTSSPGVGHVQPMIGLARAARKRGHEIAWATARDAAPLLDVQSIRVFDAGASFAECRAAYRARWPEALKLKGRDVAAHAFPRLFGEIIANDMLPSLERAIAQWTPHVVVNETGAIAAPLAARKFGIPHLTHAFGLPMPASIVHAAAEHVAPQWVAAGFQVPEFAGLYDHGAIEISPPSLLAACPNFVLARKILMQRPASVTAAPTDRLPDSLRDFLSSHPNSLSTRPVVYVTFGTLYGGNSSFNAALRAASKVNATFVATTGQGASADNHPFAGQVIPDNVWIQDYVPQSLLLPLCTVVVSHAGSGTLTGSIGHGLPQLCLPQGADQFRNADALVKCSAGLMLEDDEISESAVAGSIARLIEEFSFRHNAERLRGEIEAMPTPEDVVASIEQLCGLENG